MIKLQHTAIVKQTPSTFQTATRHKFIGAIELSGRKVLTFISHHHVGPDIELKLFILDARQTRTERRLTAPRQCPRPYLVGSGRLFSSLCSVLSIGSNRVGMSRALGVRISATPTRTCDHCASTTDDQHADH
jgi:hypothetical protein